MTVSMRALITWILALSAGLGAASTAAAGPREDQILRTSLKAGAQAAATELVKNGLKNSAGTIAGKTVTQGAAVVSVVQLGLAVNDFANAKDDRQKAYAGAQAGVAVVTLVNPAVGAAAQAILMGVQLAEAAAAAPHQKKMLEIAARIMENYKRVIEIETMLAKSEYVVFQAAFELSSSARKEIASAEETLHESCQGSDLYEDLEKVDRCVSTVSSLLGQSRILANGLKRLLEFEAAYLNIDAIYAEAGVTREELTKQLNDAEKTIAANAARMENELRVYARGVTAAVFEKARRETNPSEIVEFARLCVSDMREYSRQAALVELQNVPELDPALAKLIAEFDREELRRTGVLIVSRGCDEIASGDKIVDGQLHRTNVIFERARARMGVMP